MTVPPSPQPAAAASPPRLSVVTPCYNEELSLPRFVARTVAACAAVAGDSYELILVNDGSRDHTWSCILALSTAHPRLVAVNLSRNHGHQLAVKAGLTLARGERVMIIDADLQDPPELLGAMMTRMDEDGGYDVVFGKRRSRANENWFKLATASLFYRALDRLSDIPVPRDTGDFRLMSRRIVDRLNAMPEHDRFLRGMVAWLGGRQAELLYDRDPRFAGKTAYTLAKMLHLAVDGVTSLSTAPLRMASLLAGVGVVSAGLIVLYALTGFYLGDVAKGWTSQALITVFFGTGQLFCMAIFGAYLGRTYMQVKGRPLCMIDEVVTSQASTPLSPPSVEKV
jgi:glycosyltransferase involved in cell wall biosynthesis